MKKKKSVALIGFETALNEYLEVELRRQGILDIQTYSEYKINIPEQVLILHQTQLTPVKFEKFNSDKNKLIFLCPRSKAFEASLLVGVKNVIEYPFEISNLVSRI